jgi:VanZ family protein
VFRGPVSRRRFSGLLGFALLCWAGAILWLSSLTPRELPETAFLLSDKINHLGAFILGGWLAASTLRMSRPLASAASAVIGAVILVTAFGALDESLQKLTPGRTGGDLQDWIADILGAVIGALLSLLTQHRLERRVSGP